MNETRRRAASVTVAIAGFTLAATSVTMGCGQKQAQKAGDRAEDWKRSAPPAQYRGPGQPGGPGGAPPPPPGPPPAPSR